MRSYINVISILFTLFLSSCEKKIWDNPFDPIANKELFTPSNLIASQSGTQIKLTWTQNNSQISGFKVERKVENGSFDIIANLPKNVYSYFDASAISGKNHQYQVTAVAGNNSSNSIITNIIPASAPNITSISISSKTFSSISYNILINDGGSPIITKGLCWSTSISPTISNSKTMDGTGSGSFNSKISNLSSNVRYYIRPIRIQRNWDDIWTRTKRNISIKYCW